jgi:hypothetical protein
MSRGRARSVRESLKGIGLLSRLSNLILQSHAGVDAYEHSLFYV